MKGKHSWDPNMLPASINLIRK